MQRLTLLLACSALLAATAAAQTTPAPADEKLLEIHRYLWYEASWKPVGEVMGDGFPGKPPSLNYQWRYKNRKGRGDFGAAVTLKNVSRKPIKSVNVDFVFRDTATEQVFLTYHLNFHRRIGPGRKKELIHKISMGKEPNNFTPAAPDEAFLERTILCEEGPLLRDRKSGQLVRIKDDEKLLRAYPCYYRPVITRIDYEDGTFWQP